MILSTVVVFRSATWYLFMHMPSQNCFMDFSKDVRMVSVPQPNMRCKIYMEPIKSYIYTCSERGKYRNRVYMYEGRERTRGSVLKKERTPYLRRAIKTLFRRDVPQPPRRSKTFHSVAVYPLSLRTLHRCCSYLRTTRRMTRASSETLLQLHNLRHSLARR